MLIQPLTPEILEKRRDFRRRLFGMPGRIWRKTRRGLCWALAIAFVAHSALNIYASMLLNRELSAIRQKGEPLQFSELAPPRVPDAQNAALVYAQATKALRLSREEKTVFNSQKSQETPQQQRNIAAALAKNQRALALARRAAAMPRCVFPLNYNSYSPFELLFPYYGEMRELARLLNAQAQIEAQRGDSAAAIGDVRAVFRMANHLSNEPVLVGFLVAQAVESIANTTLDQVLRSTSISSTQARAFEDSLPKTDWNRAFERSLMGERATGIATFELTRQPNGMSIAEINSLTSGSVEESSGGILAPSWSAAPLVLLWRPVSKLDEVHNLRLWKPQLVAAASPQTSAFSNANQSFEKAVAELPDYAILTRILMPVYSQVSQNRDRGEVRHRQREIALALAVYRGAKSSYPAQLSGLASPKSQLLPLDPYSKKPFVYRLDKSGKGFTLYSVGPNRKDDGGQVPSFGPGVITGDDILWGGPRR